ncbi:DUF1501 domain-containing protein [Aquincola sp. J276]|uniref:DUF1501 domain-containing protein n=1 Tax=Aquincola sp. J276 TaxID=2898432 RepID=UPI00215131B2|nr:DUF1501 domain-containing protein [Aquincola sp. J276]MCR5866796.1 DUF1501 domain-containing protein [Aquincola sp. J276]
MNKSRRSFLNVLGGLSSASCAGVSPSFLTTMAGLGALSAQSAHASGPVGYKALVCLYMQGGNDSHNWVVPIDAGGYMEYARARGELAIARGSLDTISQSSQAAGRMFGMARELNPLRKWYESGQAALVANVGTLNRPTTLAEFKSNSGLPSKLFSHNDQAATWQSMAPEGGTSGWGGRIGDILMSANQSPAFTSVSTAGNAVFLSGRTVSQYEVGADGPVAVRGAGAQSIFYSSSAPAVLRRSMQLEGNTPYQAEYAKVMRRSVESAAQLRAAMANVSVPALPSAGIAVNAGTSISLSSDRLARQLRTVAQMVGASSMLGMRRQVFMVSIGGFDTHADQMRDQPVLMARVAHAVDYFLTSLSMMGMLNNVTLFTASDFGRTLTTNGSGSDHGWGSHHFVAGGAVNGGDIYGSFPTTALRTDLDTGSGRLLPTTAVAQYAGTLGKWMGLGNSDLLDVFPLLSRFSTHDLGFMRA